MDLDEAKDAIKGKAKAAWTNKASRWGLGISFAASFIGTQSYEIVPPMNFAARETLGQMVATNLKSGFYWKLPIQDTFYILRENTIILEASAGGSRNTKDQNDLSVEMRLHYKNNPKSGVLAYHVKEMANDGGAKLLKGLIDQSVDAAAGYKAAIDSVNDPKTLLFTVADNLQWRLNQNNVAIEVDAIEFNVLKVGGLRTPVQLRLKSQADGKSWGIENITGPATVQMIGAQIAAQNAPASAPQR